jgi:hypothetical protein
MPAVLLVAVLGATYLGFALLALSQDRHWHHLGGARHCPAYALLLASLGLSLVRDGPGFGALLWATILSVCAVAVVGTLTWQARWLRPLARLLQRIA